MRKPVVMSYLTMKGGVGKTTLAANVTRAMADLATKKAAGAPTKYLLIDADAQCNLTQIFLTPAEMDARQGRDVYQAFNASHRLFTPSDLKTTVYHNTTNNSIIDLIPGSFDTFALVVGTPAVQDSAANVFANFIKAACQEYDYVIIDTNPSATFTTLQALKTSNFLVAPITFDSFSMRGIDLIVSTLKVRYDWLSNPRRIRIVPNKIKRARDNSAQLRQEKDEQSVIEMFPHLEQSVSISRIHESNFLDNRIARRGHGFVIDQRVFAIHKPALRRVGDDFSEVARALNAALREAFGDETENKVASSNAFERALKGFLDQPVVRH
ncbi:MAG: ParA family protein [Hyphomicrobium sp.]